MANWGGMEGWTDVRMDGRLEIPPCVLQDNRSPKGSMWSAIPVALLCWSVQRPRRRQSCVEHSLSVLPSIHDLRPWRADLKSERDDKKSERAC